MDEGYSKEELRKIQNNWIDAKVIMLISAFAIGAVAFVVALCNSPF